MEVNNCRGFIQSTSKFCLSLTVFPCLWLLCQTFQTSFGQHSSGHATLAVPGCNFKRNSSQKKCSGFHMPRTAKIWSRQYFTTKTNRQEGGSERLTEARGGPRRQRKTEGPDWSRAEIKSQADLQPVCLLLLLLAPSYQQAEGSTPRPPTPPRQHSSPAPPAFLIVPSLMCPICRNARRPALCHAPKGSLATGSASLK